jgi:hypothetical protein
MPESRPHDPMLSDSEVYSEQHHLKRVNDLDAGLKLSR